MDDSGTFDFTWFDPVDTGTDASDSIQHGTLEEPVEEIATFAYFSNLAEQALEFKTEESDQAEGGRPCLVDIQTDESGERVLKILSSQGLLFEVRDTPTRLLDVRLVGAPRTSDVIGPSGRILFALPIETNDLYEFLVRLNQWSNAWVLIFGRFEPRRTSIGTSRR